MKSPLLPVSSALNNGGSTIFQLTTGKIMHEVFRNLNYRIGASSMVFGHDLVENAGMLCRMVDHVEIVLFHTSELNNIPCTDAIRSLYEIGRKYATTYSVHLPAMLEIGARNQSRRNEDIRLIRDICFRMAKLNPLHYVLHIPLSPPTLVPVQGLYFCSNDPRISKKIGQLGLWNRLRQ